MLLSALAVLALALVTVDSNHDPVRAPPSAALPLKVDWLRLESGEWLNGEFLWLGAGDVAFDSDKTGEAVWSMNEVTDIYIVRPALLVFEGGETRSGVAVIDSTKVQVDDGDESVARPRTSLLRILGGFDEQDEGAWAFGLTLGLDVVRGNSEQSALAVDTQVTRESAMTRGRIGYRGRLGSSLQQVGETTGPDGQTIPVTEDRRNTNRHEGHLSADWLFSQRFFWRVVDGSALYDEFRDIALRVQPASFLGYQIFDRPDLELDVSLGGGYQYTSFISAVDDISTGGPFVASRLSWDLTSNVDIEADVELFADLGLGNSENNQSSVNLAGSLDLDITAATDLSLGFTYEYVAEPQGINPLTQQRASSTDFALLVGIGVELD